MILLVQNWTTRQSISINYNMESNPSLSSIIVRSGSCGTSIAPANYNYATTSTGHVGNACGRNCRTSIITPSFNTTAAGDGIVGSYDDDSSSRKIFDSLSHDEDNMNYSDVDPSAEVSQFDSELTFMGSDDEGDVRAYLEKSDNEDNDNDMDSDLDEHHEKFNEYEVCNDIEWYMKPDHSVRMRRNIVESRS